MKWPWTQLDLCPPTFFLSFPGGGLQQGGGKDQLPHQPRQPHPHVLRPPLGLPRLRDPDPLRPVGGGLAALAVTPGAGLPPGLPPPRRRLPAPLSSRYPCPLPSRTRLQAAESSKVLPKGLQVAEDDHHNDDEDEAATSPRQSCKLTQVRVEQSWR